MSAVPTWTPAQDDLLMERLAEGDSFAAVSKIIGRSKDAVRGRFVRLSEKYGWQAA